MKIGYRLDQYTFLPDDWFICGTLVERPRDRFGPQEYWYVWLRLPSWQLRFAPELLADAWHQLALFFHGRDGFSFRWLRDRDDHGVDP